MRIKIRHETHYAYETPAICALQLLRLTPRSGASQFVRRWRVEVDVDARLDKGEDAFGNITHMVFAEGPIQQLKISVEGDVHTHDTSGVVSGTVERLPRSFFLRETALTHGSEQITHFARDCQAAEGGDLLSALHAITALLHNDMKYEIGATVSTTTAAEAFERKRGVCQDFAHVLVAAARALHAPARYVSGYYLRTDRVEQEAGHAWAEVYVPNLGWVGFDPTQGMCVTEQYVRVAIGPDYRDAAPVRGAQFGGMGESLGVAVVVRQEQQMIEG